MEIETKKSPGDLSGAFSSLNLTTSVSLIGGLHRGGPKLSLMIRRF
jgi:hypothetical protein